MEAGYLRGACGLNRIDGECHERMPEEFGMFVKGMKNAHMECMDMCKWRHSCFGHLALESSQEQASRSRLD